MASSSSLERTMIDLKAARLEIHRLEDIIDSFQVNPYSIFTLADQWRSCLTSFSQIHNSIESKVNELECKERDITVVANNKLHNFRDEFELKRKTLEDGERSLREKIKQVELRQNEVKKWMELIGAQRREISERLKVVEAQETELLEGLERVKKVEEEEIRVRKAELEVNEYRTLVELDKTRLAEVAKDLESWEERIDECCKNVDLRENVVDERFKTVELREKGLDERCKELELREREIKDREKDLGLVEMKIKESEQALEVDETGLEERERVMGAKEMRLMTDQQALELRQHELDERERVMGAKEMRFMKDQQALELRQDELDERERVMGAKEMRFMKDQQALELRHHELDERERVMGVKEMRFMKDQQALELRHHELDERDRVMGAKEMRFMKDQQALELRQHELDERERLMGAKEMRFMKDQQALELRQHELDEVYSLLEQQEIKFDETLKRVESKEKELILREEEMNVKHEVLKLKEKDIFERCLNVKEGDLKNGFIRALEDKANEINARFTSLVAREEEVDSEVQMLCKKLDLNDMRSFMCTKEHNVLHDQIFAALKSVRDPAKLVLNMSKSFFKTGLDEVENDAIRTRCIYLLELLIKISPSITPDVEHEAREFAAFWKQRVRFPIIYFGYLHFLAAYRLAMSCKGKDLLSLFKSSYFAAKLYPPEKNVDLCCALGLQDKIPDFIRSLIQRQRPLEAVKCISLLKMECDFPPVQLVEVYLEHVKQKLDAKLNPENFQGKVDVTAIELSHLREALSSIRNLKLELKLPTESVTLRIKELETETKRKGVKSSKKRDALLSAKKPTVELEKRPRMESGMAPWHQWPVCKYN